MHPRFVPEVARGRRFANGEDQRTSPVTPRALRMKYVEQNKRERSFLSPKAMRSARPVRQRFL